MNCSCGSKTCTASELEETPSPPYPTLNPISIVSVSKSLNWENENGFVLAYYKWQCISIVEKGPCRARNLILNSQLAATIRSMLAKFIWTLCRYRWLPITTNRRSIQKLCYYLRWMGEIISFITCVTRWSLSRSMHERKGDNNDVYGMTENKSNEKSVYLPRLSREGYSPFTWSARTDGFSEKRPSEKKPKTNKTKKRKKNTNNKTFYKMNPLPTSGFLRVWWHLAINSNFTMSIMIYWKRCLFSIGYPPIIHFSVTVAVSWQE